ncbi:hypothetical protein EG68_00902 [Paragonimus skrjabini miyazakii]|uniref:Cadherin domain-containing protein n=1 Tax=Paragonimus skrjabini miyazakii TaxID=59628 RepID=A0A8S9ZCA8_9TREM|nr:hypothetical protein EG68_00902 [Paragonimus skrjabini miyazakii]
MISYSILSGNEAGHFELDSNTGWIYLAQALIQRNSQLRIHSEQSVAFHKPNSLAYNKWYLHSPSVIRLYVQASDHGTPPRATSSVLDVIVQPPFTTSMEKFPTKDNRGFGQHTHGIDSFTDEKVSLTRTESNIERVSSWIGENQAQNTSGFLVASDFLTLIAMITATLAALMLIFILFVVIRCRRMKTTPSFSNSLSSTAVSTTATTACHVPGDFRYKPQWFNAINMSPGDTRDYPTRSDRFSSIRPLSNSTYASPFWSRFGFSRCLARSQIARLSTNDSGSKKNNNKDTHQMDNRRSSNPYEPASVLVTQSKEQFGSGCSIADVRNMDHHPEGAHFGDLLVYNSKSPMQPSYPPSASTNVNSNDYSLLVHSVHPIDSERETPVRTCVMLNNAPSRTDKLCTHAEHFECPTANFTTYPLSCLAANCHDVAETSPNVGSCTKLAVADRLSTVQRKGRANLQDLYTPLFKSKTEANTVCQPSSFV